MRTDIAVNNKRRTVTDFVRQHVPEGADWPLVETAKDIFAKAVIAGFVTTHKSVEQILVRIRRVRLGGTKASNREKYQQNLSAMATVLAEKEQQIENLRVQFLAEVEKNKNLQCRIDYLQGLLLSIQEGINEAKIPLDD